MLNASTFINQIAEILARDLALASDFPRFLAFRAEFLDAALQADAEVVGGETEHFAYGGGYAVRV